MTADRRVEYMNLDAIESAHRNPKEHDGEGIARSISTFGFAELPLLDERTGRLVAGHGRINQLRAARTAGDTPPSGVRTDDQGGWLVPLIRGWASRSDADAEAYVVASNNLTTRGGWDEEELGQLLSDLNDIDPGLLAVTGFTQEELDALLDQGDAGPDDEADLGDPDDAPDVPQTEPVTRYGDTWALGPHRLLCGDSTDLAAVEAMLAGDRADCMWTDPPYGVNYVGKTKDKLTIKNDAADGLPGLLAGAFAVATAALKPGAAVYVCHAPGPLSLDFTQAFNTAGWLWRQNLVWVKDVLVLGRSDYHYRHEPILYGFTDGGDGRLGRGGGRWFADNSQTSVFEVPKPARSEVHPNMKPVDLVAAMLRASCPEGGIVYEPFGGSGSTLIAAHRTGRVARVVELDPKYCDVICRRFEQYAGIMPVLESTGEAVSFIPAEGES